MMLLDAGYLVALVKPRDALHRRTRAWAAVLDEPVVVTEYVLCEVVDAPSRPADRFKAHELINGPRNDPVCMVIPGAATKLRL